MNVKVKVLDYLASFSLWWLRQLFLIINHLVPFRFYLDVAFETSPNVDGLCLILALLFKLAYDSTPEDLERWGDELLASRASWTLPTVWTYLNCTVLTRTNYVSLTAILLIDPLHSSDEERTALRSICIWHLCESLAKDLIAVYNKFLISICGSLLYSLRWAACCTSSETH
jgi:hypothetical protein